MCSQHSCWLAQAFVAVVPASKFFFVSIQFSMYKTLECFKVTMRPQIPNIATTITRSAACVRLFLADREQETNLHNTHPLWTSTGIKIAANYYHVVRRGLVCLDSLVMATN